MGRPRAEQPARFAAGKVALVLIALCAATETTAADAAAGPPELEGVWTAVEARRDGGPAEEDVGHRLELASGRFRISARGETLYAGTYAVDPGARPARIDFHNDEGRAKGQDWEGIYRLEGDRLTICDDAFDPTHARPIGFTTSPGSGHVLITFRRS